MLGAQVPLDPLLWLAGAPLPEEGVPPRPVLVLLQWQALLGMALSHQEPVPVLVQRQAGAHLLSPAP